MSKIKRYIPKVLQENDTMDSIYSTQEDEINKLNETSMEVFHNNFVKTCDLKGVKKYEEILKIKPDVDFDLEYRKQKILDKLTYRPPFTKQRFQSILERIWGVENFLFKILPDKFQVIIDINTNNPKYYISYSTIIRNVIPANMYLILSLQYTYLYLQRNYTYSKLNQSMTYEELSKYSQEDFNL